MLAFCGLIVLCGPFGGIFSIVFGGGEKVEEMSVERGWALAEGLGHRNAIALSLIAIQSTWKCVPLDPEAYYVDAVPVLLDVPRMAGMELLAFGLCVMAILLPALWSARIRPSRTLRMS